MAARLETPAILATKGMSDTTDPEGKARAMVRIGSGWIPAHQLWAKIGTMTAVLEIIDRFNQRHPELASAATRDVVRVVRQRLKAIDLRIPGRRPPDDLGAIAADLLAAGPPEDALDVLAERHGVQLDMRQLIQLAGEQAYAGAVARESVEFSHNQISPEQTARLWNEAGRPAPGGGLWSKQKIEALLREKS